MMFSLRHRWEDNIKADSGEVVCVDGNRTELVLSRVVWCAFMKYVMNLGFHIIKEVLDL
jgi:hypothetical protein